MDKSQFHLDIIPGNIYLQRRRELGFETLNEDYELGAALVKYPHYKSFHDLFIPLSEDLVLLRLVNVPDIGECFRESKISLRKKGIVDIRQKLDLAEQTGRLIVEYAASPLFRELRQNEILYFGRNHLGEVICRKVVVPRDMLLQEQPPYTISIGLKILINRDRRPFLSVEAVNYEDVLAQPENVTELVYGERISSFKHTSLRAMLRKKPRHH